MLITRLTATAYFGQGSKDTVPSPPRPRIVSCIYTDSEYCMRQCKTTQWRQLSQLLNNC